MGQFLHGSAKTTYAVRALIQRSKTLNAALSRELGINVKTIAKWRKRDYVADAQMGPKEVHSTVLRIEEEAVIVAFRRHTLLPLDDCLYALRPTIPHPLTDRVFPKEMSREIDAIIAAQVPAAAWDQSPAGGRR